MKKEVVQGHSFDGVEDSAAGISRAADDQPKKSFLWVGCSQGTKGKKPTAQPMIR
jgi:hypothetical protein